MFSLIIPLLLSSMAYAGSTWINLPPSGGASITPNSCSTGQYAYGIGSTGTLSCSMPTVSAGGSDTDVQYNSSGSLAGNSNFTYNGSGLNLGVNLNFSGDNVGNTWPNGSSIYEGGGSVFFITGQAGIQFSANSGSITFDQDLDLYGSLVLLGQEGITGYNFQSGAILVGDGNGGIIANTQLGAPLTVNGPEQVNGSVSTSNSTLDDGSGNATIGNTLTVVAFNGGEGSTNAFSVQDIDHESAFTVGTFFGTDTVSTKINTLDNGSGNFIFGFQNTGVNWPAGSIVDEDGSNNLNLQAGSGGDIVLPQNNLVFASNSSGGVIFGTYDSEITEASGGTLTLTGGSGTVNVPTSNLTLGQLLVLPVQPSGVTPSGVDGALALTNAHILCVYNGSTWTNAGTGIACTF